VIRLASEGFQKRQYDLKCSAGFIGVVLLWVKPVGR